MHVIRKEINIFSMNSDYSLNFSADSTLPELLPEESLFNDLIYADVPALAITHPDIATLNRRLDQITLAPIPNPCVLMLKRPNGSD